jgi:beta-glucosidase
MEGSPAWSRADTAVHVAWGMTAPRTGMNADNFGVRWTGVLRPPSTGTYRLGLIGTMRFQLFVDDSMVVRSTYSRDDEFPDQRLVSSGNLRLEAGRSYRIRVEARESYGEADLELVWARPSEGLEADAVKAAEGADAVVMFLGLTANLEGEEMRVQVDGFRGGDRTKIALPAPQQRLLERIVALGRPTVLVLLSGSALDVTWAREHVPAIVQAWYPGQAAGTAIAEVLFGDYNPGGRLPITFYHGVDDLPPFEDYAMAGRTYRFFDGPVLFPFGHGLSYTTFAYDSLRVSNDTLDADGVVTVRVNVTNIGKRRGDEVVQLYVQHPKSRVTRPRLDLRGFRRITLAPGETRTVEFKLTAGSLRYWDPDADRWLAEEAPVRITVGSSSEDLRLDRTIRLANRP